MARTPLPISDNGSFESGHFFTKLKVYDEDEEKSNRDLLLVRRQEKRTSEIGESRVVKLELGELHPREGFLEQHPAREVPKMDIKIPKIKMQATIQSASSGIETLEYEGLVKLPILEDLRSRNLQQKGSVYTLRPVQPESQFVADVTSHMTRKHVLTPELYGEFAPSGAGFEAPLEPWPKELISESDHRTLDSNRVPADVLLHPKFFLYKIVNLRVKELEMNNGSFKLYGDFLSPGLFVARNCWNVLAFVIKDCKIKESILNEFSLFLKDIQLSLERAEKINIGPLEASLTYFRKLLLAYNVYEKEWDESDDTESVYSDARGPLSPHSVTSFSSTNTKLKRKLHKRFSSFSSLLRKPKKKPDTESLTITSPITPLGSEKDQYYEAVSLISESVNRLTNYALYLRANGGSEPFGLVSKILLFVAKYVVHFVVIDVIGLVQDHMRVLLDVLKGELDY